MRKKLLTLVMVGMMTATVLAGCGSTKNSGTAASQGGHFSEVTSEESVSEAASSADQMGSSEVQVTEPIESGKETETKASDDADSSAVTSESIPESETVGSEAAGEEAAESAAADADGVTPSFKEYMDSYEEFMNGYCDFLEKYNENPTDAELLAEYMDYMDRYTEFMKKVNEYGDEESEMSTADLNYYLDVTNRVNKRLLAVSASAADSE